MARTQRSWWWWRLGAVGGIAIRVHLTLILLLAWIAVTYASTGAGARGTAVGLLLVVAVFTAVLVHELGHAFVARRFGYRTRDIMLLPIGGIATLEQMPEKPTQELAVAVVGPAINLAIAGVIWIGITATGGQTSLGSVTSLSGSFLAQLFWINIGLAAFNMVPAFPMDGGRALRALLALKLGRERATEIAGTLGRVFAVLIGFYGLLYNPFLVLIAFVVWMGASQERAMVHLKSALHGVPVSAAMLRRIETVSPEQPLEDAAALLVSGGQNELPVIDHGQPIGVLTRGDVASALAHAGPDATVATAPHHEIVTVAPDDSLDVVLERLRASPEAVAIVVDHGQPVGLVTPERLANYVALHGRPAS
ncbi:MAG: Peptidase [Myxococcales bacterium]|nr:Peptidase [Myxococcales bacterium]